MAQQGSPPGRHSRGPHPGDSPYSDETRYDEAARYGDDVPYPEAPYTQAPYQEAPSSAEDPYREAPHREAPYPGARHAGDAPYTQAPYPQESYAAPPSGGDAPLTEAPYTLAPHTEAPYRDDAPAPGYGSRTDGGVRPDAGFQSGGGVQPGGGMRSGRGPLPERGERHGRLRRADPHRQHRDTWQQGDPFRSGSDTDPDLPAWAGPAVYPGRPTGTVRRPATPRPLEDADYREPEAKPGPTQIEDGGEGDTRTGRRRGRAAATRLRKSRRRVYRLGGVAIAACVVAAGVVLLVTHHSPKPTPYVTSLQHGEFTAVPSACTSVGTPVLNQFLPGPGRTSTSTLSSSTNSQCSFTVDSKPNFIVLEVQAQSFQPFAAAANDGSATGNAKDSFALAQFGLAHPPKKSPVSPAQITTVTGLGQQAFMAFQHAHVTGIITDTVTLVVRERNVVITASLAGQESGHGFGPVPVSTLEAGARAAAQAVLAKVMTEPTA